MAIARALTITDEASRVTPLRRPASPGATGSAPGRFEIRKMRYFRDLLAEGYRTALEPGRHARTLRAERIALGVNRPELDAVPYWSSRREDGMISIPFIEFILAQMCDLLEDLARSDEQRGSRQGVAGPRAALSRALQEANRGGLGALASPRLGDAFLPGAFVARLCERGALLDQIVGCFEAIPGPWTRPTHA